MKPIQLFNLDSLEKHTPLVPATATLTIGTGTDGEIDLINSAIGEAGNDIEVAIVNGEGEDLELAVTFADNVLTITLGTDSNGDPDDAKNTATLVAAAIEAATDLTATASGTGADPIAAIEGTESFVGGVNGTPLQQGQACYDDDYLYLAVGNNTITSSSNIKKIALAAL